MVPSLVTELLASTLHWNLSTNLAYSPLQYKGQRQLPKPQSTVMLKKKCCFCKFKYGGHRDVRGEGCKHTPLLPAADIITKDHRVSLWGHCWCNDTTCLDKNHCSRSHVLPQGTCISYPWWQEFNWLDSIDIAIWMKTLLEHQKSTYFVLNTQYLSYIKCLMQPCDLNIIFTSVHRWENWDSF